MSSFSFFNMSWVKIRGGGGVVELVEVEFKVIPSFKTAVLYFAPSLKKSKDNCPL